MIRCCCRCVLPVGDALKPQTLLPSFLARSRGHADPPTRGPARQVQEQLPAQLCALQQENGGEDVPQQVPAKGDTQVATGSTTWLQQAGGTHVVPVYRAWPVAGRQHTRRAGFCAWAVAGRQHTRRAGFCAWPVAGRQHTRRAGFCAWPVAGRQHTRCTGFCAWPVAGREHTRRAGFCAWPVGNHRETLHLRSRRS